MITHKIPLYPNLRAQNSLNVSNKIKNTQNYLLLLVLFLAEMMPSCLTGNFVFFFMKKKKQIQSLKIFPLCKVGNREREKKIMLRKTNKYLI